MDEMLRFLFKSTMRTDSALRAIAKTFKYQRKFNRWVLLTHQVLGAGYLVLGAGYFENQHEIAALKREISLMKEPTENANGDTGR